MAVYQAYTDQQLMALLKEEDRTAFTEIFNRYNKLLYSHVFNKLRDEETARDLVQDVFVVLWEKRKSVQHIHLAGYLFTMSRNRLLNLLSHHKVVADHFASIQNFVPGHMRMADDLIIEKQLSTIINEEIENLPLRMREIFKLSRFEHLKNKEIAEKLNLSEHTVADQIKKSLKILRYKIGLSILMFFIQQAATKTGLNRPSPLPLLKNPSFISTSISPTDVS